MPRSELAEFLRARRAAVRPEDVGLPPSLGTRRVPGLRREELATAAGVSVDYYTRLEQGRAERASDEVLDAIARTLGLSADEREHLGRLASAGRSARRAPSLHVDVPTRTLLDALAAPAFVLGPRMEVLAWNGLAAALIADFGALPPAERNMARLAFLDADVAARYLDREAVVEETVAVLRWSAGRLGADDRMEALVAELTAVSPVFARTWARAGVRRKTSGRKRLRHPLVGDITLAYQAFGTPREGQTLVVYTAAAGSADADALTLLASWSLPVPS